MSKTAPCRHNCGLNLLHVAPLSLRLQSLGCFAWLPADIAVVTNLLHSALCACSHLAVMLVLPADIAADKSTSLGPSVWPSSLSARASNCHTTTAFLAKPCWLLRLSRQPGWRFYSKTIIPLCFRTGGVDCTADGCPDGAKMLKFC